MSTPETSALPGEPTTTTHFRTLYEQETKAVRRLVLRTTTLENGIESILQLVNGETEGRLKAVKVLLEQILAAAREKGK